MLFAQLLELTTIAFKATKILLTVRDEIHVNRSFQSFRNRVNSGIWYSCQPQLFRGTKILSSTLTADNSVAFRAI